MGINTKAQALNVELDRQNEQLDRIDGTLPNSIPILILASLLALLFPLRKIELSLCHSIELFQELEMKISSNVLFLCFLPQF